MIYQTNRKFFNFHFSISNNRQAGVTLLLAILILSSILAISFSLATVLFIEVRDAGDLIKTEPALYAATGVGEEAFFNLERRTCPGNGSGCYNTQFANSVILNGTPTVLSTSTPIFSDEVKLGSTFANTPNKYDFCNDFATSTGCGYGYVKLLYNVTSTNNNQLNAYMCQWNQNELVTSSGGGGNYATSPCSDSGNSPSDLTNGADSYWLAPNNGTLTGGDGSVLLSPGNTTVSWTLNPNLQQELILVNTNNYNTGNIYVQISTYSDTAGTIGKGLPFVGKTVVDVNTINSAVGRKIQVMVPNSSVTSSGSGVGSTTKFSVVASPTSATTGALVTNGLTITALDSNNNIVTNYSGTVQFSSTDGAASLPSNSTLSNGTGTFSYTLNTAGSQTITATDASNSSITGTSNAISVTSSTNGYAYYRVLTVQGSQVSTVNHTTLSNFTVLVCANGSAPCNFSAPSLKQTSSGGHVQNSNGYDIIFTSDSGCSQLLSWEVENYVPSTGELEAWVKMPVALSYGSNTTFYMCYGKSGISSPQWSQGTAWDSNYVGIYHMPNGTTLSANDSSSLGNNGTNNGLSATAGAIGGGASNSGSGGTNIEADNVSNSLQTGNVTFSTWVKLNSNYTTGNQVMIDLSDGPSANDVYLEFGTENFGDCTDGKLCLAVYTGSAFNSAVSPGSYVAGTWYNIVGTYSTTNGSALYVNGNQVATNSSTGRGSPPSAHFYVAGTGVNNGSPINGKVDEAEVSSVARSADWVSTEYNSQSAPSSFCPIGSEQ
jgi:hypothetical protein